MPNIIKLINLKRGHVFRFAGEERFRLLNENYVSKDNPLIIHFEWHTIFKDGHTSLRGTGCNRLFAETQMVVDLGDFYDWMKKHHPIRYKRENWEASRQQQEE